jgi:hypothetical protein
VGKKEIFAVRCVIAGLGLVCAIDVDSSSEGMDLGAQGRVCLDLVFVLNYSNSSFFFCSDILFRPYLCVSSRIGNCGDAR